MTHVATSILTGFERRDWLTVVASSGALCVSALTYLQRWRAGRLALRKQLTDLLQKLSDLAMQADMFRALHGQPKHDDYPKNYLALVNDQRRFLVRQAEFITREIAALVSPYEYLLIASAFDAVGDGAQAERYFDVAATRATTPVDRGIALRQYGQYLSTREHQAEARDKYALAIAAFAGETDDMRLYRAQTYERWARAERAWDQSDEAAKRLAAAETACHAIANPRRRHHELQRLARARVEAAGGASGSDCPSVCD